MQIEKELVKFNFYRKGNMIKNKDYYELLNRGLNTLQNSRNQMELAYIVDEIKKECNEIEKYEADKKIKSHLVVPLSLPLDQISVRELKVNLKYYCETLWEKIKNEQQNMKFPSYNTINVLLSKNFYSKTDVIYQNNGYILDVSKLLDTIEYGLNIANILFGAETEECENYITILKGLNRIFNNDTLENPLKDLSYSLEVFCKIQNYFETNPVQKRENKILSISVNLFIEFLLN